MTAVTLTHTHQGLTKALKCKPSVQYTSVASMYCSTRNTLWGSMSISILNHCSCLRSEWVLFAMTIIWTLKESVLTCTLQFNIAVLKNIQIPPSRTFCDVGMLAGIQRRELREVLAVSVYKSRCRSYRYPYTLVLLKRSHQCLFCPSRACQEARKAVEVRKSNNFWMKSFKRKLHD